MKIINPEQVLIQIARILKELKIKYFVTGGFAVSVWGRPRATFDIDIVIKLIEPQVIPLASALREIFKAGYIDEDMVKEAIQHKGEFNFVDPESGLKVDFWVKGGSKLALAEFKRRRLKRIDGQGIYFVSPEDLILIKLRWYRQTESSRHLEDIESIIKISGPKLDMDYLKKQTRKLGYRDTLNKLL